MERSAALLQPDAAPPGIGADLVVLADDQLTLKRMTSALARVGLGDPVGADSLDEAIEAAGRVEQPLVAFYCDVSDPERMADLRRLRKASRSARILVVAPPTNSAGVRRALEAGADGLVHEADVEQALVAALTAVVAGQVTAPQQLRSGLQKPAFSHRERQVLALVAKGLSNCSIAEALYLSESTVKSHLSTAFAKLGVRSRKEAAALVLDEDQGLGADLLATGVPALAGVRAPGAP